MHKHVFRFPPSPLSHEATSCPAGSDAGVTQPDHSTSLALICAVTLSGGEWGAGTGARSMAGLPPGTLTRPCLLPNAQQSKKHNGDAVGSQTRFSRQLKVVSSCAQERGRRRLCGKVKNKTQQTLQDGAKRTWSRRSLLFMSPHTCSDQTR